MVTPFYYRIYHTLFIKCSIHTLKLTKEDRRFRDLENSTFIGMDIIGLDPANSIFNVTYEARIEGVIMGSIRK